MGNKQGSKRWDLTLLLLQTFISLLFSGGIVWLFTEFKQHFPNWLYTTIIAVVAVVLIGFLIRLVFADLIERLLRWIRKHREKAQGLGLALEFSKQWGKLANLITKAICSNKPPSDKQEDDFRRLRHWFISHRNWFNDSWHTFEYNRVGGATEHYERYTLAEKIFSTADPFSFFYQPPSIGGVAVMLDLDVSGRRWSITDWKRERVLEVVRVLNDLMLEYVNWIRTD